MAFPVVFVAACDFDAKRGGPLGEGADPGLIPAQEFRALKNGSKTVDLFFRTHDCALNHLEFETVTPEVSQQSYQSVRENLVSVVDVRQAPHVDGAVQKVVGEAMVDTQRRFEKTLGALLDLEEGAEGGGCVAQPVLASGEGDDA